MAADASRLHKVFHSTPDLQGEVMVPTTELTQEEKRRSHSQEDLFVLALNARNSRHSLACPPQRTSSLDKTRAHSHGSNGSWQEEEDFDSDSPNETPCVMDHRRLRRSQSAINSSQLKKAGIHPPPTHPPPPVPMGQVVKVDISRSKSDYAAVGVAPSTPEEVPLSPGVMSSFRPSDCAKLYASPEDMKAVGYRNHENGTLNRKANGSKARSQSLPPSTNRPNVQRGSPDKDTSIDSGIYSTTYSTFRGTNDDPNRNCDLPPPPPEALKQTDPQTYARPKNNKVISEMHHNPSKDSHKAYTGPGSVPTGPNIPDPDYSSDDENTYNSQYEDLPNKKTRPTKKKKQTVMFAPNLVSSSKKDMSDIPHYAAPSNSPPTADTNSTSSTSSENSNSNNSIIGGTNFKDMIAQKAAERKARLENGGGSAPASATSSPSKRINGSNGIENKCLSNAIQESALFNKQREKTTNGQIRQKPEETSPKEDSKNKLKMKNSRSCPNDFSMEDGDNSSSGVSSDQDVHQESNYVTVINTESELISPTKSERLTRNSSKDDSSEASESSDEASDRTWILTNDKSDKSDSGKDSDSNGSRRSGTLTRNAVSLVKLPPPQETTEPDLDNDLEIGNNRIMSRSMDQDTISTISSLSSLSSGSGSTGERDSIQAHGYNNQQLMHQNYHPQMTKHQANSQMVMSTHGHANTNTTPSHQHPTPTSSIMYRAGSAPPASHAIRNVVGGTLGRSRSATRDHHHHHQWSCDAESIGGVREKSAPPSRSATLDRNFFQSNKNSRSPDAKNKVECERSIEESLQLIRMHMDSLNEVNSLAGISSNAKGPENPALVLAPPPEFSDPYAQAHLEAAKRRNKTVIHISNDTEDPPVRIFKRGQPIDDFDDTAPKTFRNKTLSEWTTKDTTDWLEAIFMPQYKDSFYDNQIDGHKLMGLNNDALISLGVRRVGHRVDMEKSLKRYRPVERIDL